MDFRETDFSANVHQYPLCLGGNEILSLTQTSYMLKCACWHDLFSAFDLSLTKKAPFVYTLFESVFSIFSS